MHRIGRFHFQRQMGPLAAVEPYRLLDHAPGLGKIPRTLQEQLCLRYAVDPLGPCILAAIAVAVICR
jgi:hypothetical protein